MPKCPEIANANFDPTSVASCSNKIAGEACDIKSKGGTNTKRRASILPGSRACVAQPVTLIQVDSCQSLTNIDDCLSRSEGGKPYCWKEDCKRQIGLGMGL